MSDHIPDADLIRYLDGELTAVDKAAIDASPEASARLNALRRRSARMTGLLTSINPAADQVRSSADRIRPELDSAARRRRFVLSPPMKAAAAIALLLGFGLAIPPVRAMIIDWTRLAAHAIGIGSPAAEPVTPSAAQPSPEPPSPSISLGFDVTADTFNIRHAMTTGVLVIQRWEEPKALAEATGGGDPSYIVQPGGVRIAGTPAAGAVYTIKLPARVKTVRIVVDGKPTRFVVITNLEPVRIDLSQ